MLQKRLVFARVLWQAFPNALKCDPQPMQVSEVSVRVRSCRLVRPLPLSQLHRYSGFELGSLSTICLLHLCASVHLASHLLPNLVTTDHDGACGSDLQTPGRPPLEQARKTLLSEDMP